MRFDRPEPGPALSGRDGKAPVNFCKPQNCVGGSRVCTRCARAAGRAGDACGVIIESTAEAIYDEAGMARSVSSNPVQVRVDELLAVAVASRDAGPVAARAGQVALRFLIENTGNGPEQFIIEPDTGVAGNGFDAVLAGIAVDSTGNEAYDAGGRPDPGRSGDQPGDPC